MLVLLGMIIVMAALNHPPRTLDRRWMMVAGLCFIAVGHYL
jgi:uncharacterized membrane protein YhhN